jgi:hypothetical protein
VNYNDNISAIETTYNDFIWRNCIGDDFSVSDEVPTVNCYTDQEMRCNEETYSSSVDELADVLSSNSDYISYLLVGDAGCGKSSLCFSLYTKLKNNESCIPFLISSEAIRNYVDDKNYIPDNIGNLYDLYEIQAKCNEHTIILDRKKFDISLCSGNIVIIVDGLDEFPSIFGDKFDTNILLSSISDSHSQLGKSRILITSRDTKFVDNERFDDLYIKKYELLGFKEIDCKRYVRKKFKDQFDGIEKIVSMIIDILKNNTFELDDRVIPFILVQICNIYNSSDDKNDFTDFFTKMDFPFKCIGSFTDHLVYGTFKREKARHKFPITALEMFNIFWTFSAKYGKTWPITKVVEDISLLYDEKSESILRCIKINSFISVNEGFLVIKNDFTFSYLRAVYYINSLVSGTVYSEDVEAFSKLRYESKEFKEVKFYLKKYQCDVVQVIGTVINFLREELKGNISKQYKSVLISSIENLFSLSLATSELLTRESATYYFKQFFSHGINVIEHCYIKGEIPPLDFTSLLITNSKFSHYPKFLNSKFDSANFMYTIFESCNNSNVRNENLLLAGFDRNSCTLGDLDEAIISISENVEKEKDLIESECTKFFSSFRKGIYFKGNNKQYIKFSTVVNGLSRVKFDSLVREGYIEISEKKEVDTFYKVASNFEDSVKELMTNALIDYSMEKFIAHVSK